MLSILITDLFHLNIISAQQMAKVSSWLLMIKVNSINKILTRPCKPWVNLSMLSEWILKRLKRK